MSLTNVTCLGRPGARPSTLPSPTDAATAVPGDSLLDELVLVFELAPVGLCVLRNRVIQRCNRGFAEMFGYSVEELRSTSLARLHPSPEEFEHIGQTGLPAMQATGSCSDDRIMLRRDGHQFWCHVAGRSMDRDDPFACSVWMFEDLSAQRPITTHLTARERDIVRELVTGKTSKQIARHLSISHRTVEAHRARLMRKLDASTPGQMIARLAGAA